LNVGGSTLERHSTPSPTSITPYSQSCGHRSMAAALLWDRA
jgi:hypothetical protein